MQKGIIAAVAGTAFALGLCCGSVAAQTTTVVISDSSGNQATGTINNGNVYFHDANGNVAFGTIRDGNVSISTNEGEIIFGTIRGGNVFLTDQKGVTTGTIRNGNIFLAGSDGSLTTGTYDHSGNISTTTNIQSPNNAPSVQTIEQQRQADYNTGAAIDYGITSALIARHQLKAFCKANPTGTYQSSDGTYSYATPCPDAPLDASLRKDVDDYCIDHPGSSISVGLHKVDCTTPPNLPNLKWAMWEMKNQRTWYELDRKKQQWDAVNNASELWEQWRGIYCSLSSPDAAYKDLEGKKQHCR